MKRTHAGLQETIISSEDQISSSKLHRSLATDTPQPGLLNVVTGHHATVNDEYINIGRKQVAVFETGLQTSFNKTLVKYVALMTSTKKIIRLEGKPVYDTKFIYTRVIRLQQCRDIDIKDVLSY